MNTDQKKICDDAGLTQSIIESHGISPSVISFNAQSTLFKPNDSCQAFLILCSGSIRVEMTAKSGRELTLYRMQPSESCILTTSALLNSEYYYAQGIAESDITAIALSVDDFHKATQFSNRFTQYVLSSYASRISSVLRLVDRMAARDVMFDVCQYLVSSANQQMLVVATQTQIANEIGTVREVVGRKLHTLELDNIIELKRGEVVIKNMKYLRDAAQM
jgi:CRP/FNR family transcriptional regulator